MMNLCLLKVEVCQPLTYSRHSPYSRMTWPLVIFGELVSVKLLGTKLYVVWAKKVRGFGRLIK